MRLPACLLLLLALAPASAQEAAPNPPLADFPIDHFATTASPADVRFLLDAPAGKHGFIGVSGGHLATPDGTRIRFWGVNLAGWTTGSSSLTCRTRSGPATPGVPQAVWLPHRPGREHPPHSSAQ